MKAVVLEVKNDKASVLKNNGDIILIKQNELKPGDVIDIFGTTRGEGIGPVITEGLKRLIAAAIVFSVTAGGCVITYNTAFTAAYVSVDINPAIEFKLNRWNRVIDISSVNDEALTIVQKLDKLHLKGKPIDKAIKTTTVELSDNSYLKDDANYILINVTSDEDARTETLTAAIEDVFDESGSSRQVFTNAAISSNTGSGKKSAAIDSSTSETADTGQADLIYLINTGTLTDHQMAQNLGISAGRYQEMRIVEARNSINGSSVRDNEKISKRASEIQIDKSLAERYKNASVEDLFKGAGAISGSYIAPKLKRDDGKVSIKDLNINYETRSADESAVLPQGDNDFAQGIDGTIVYESQGLDPIEEAAILNEALENGAVNSNSSDSDSMDSSTDTAGIVSGTESQSFQESSAASYLNPQQPPLEKGPSVPNVPSDTSISEGPVSGSDSSSTTFGPQVPGNS